MVMGVNLTLHIDGVLRIFRLRGNPRRPPAQGSYRACMQQAPANNDLINHKSINNQSIIATCNMIWKNFE